jgi:hypothetical protein
VSRRHPPDGLGQGGNLDAEFAYGEAVQHAFAAGLLGKLLLDSQAMTHAVLNLGTRTYDLCCDWPDRLGQRPGISVLADAYDRPTPRARRLICLADDLIKDQARGDPMSDAVDADVNWLGEQLMQLAFPVRMTFEECDRIEGDSLVGWHHYIVAAAGKTHRQDRWDAAGRK